MSHDDDTGNRNNVWTMLTNEPLILRVPVLGPPALDETHADGAHPGELVDGLKALVDWLGEQGCKLLVVEDLQIAAWKTDTSSSVLTTRHGGTERSAWGGVMLTWRYLADGGRMPAVTLVAVGALDEDGAVTETLRKHLPPNVVQPHAPP